jgi:hypothetical protein
VIIRNINLLGDTVYTLKPIADLRMQRSGEAIVVGVANDLSGEMVRRQFAGTQVEVVDIADLSRTDVDLSAGAASRMCTAHLLRYGSYLHISECYAEMLGVDSSKWRGDFTPLTDWRARWGDKGLLTIPSQVHPYVVISPFSRSCSRQMGMRPNKTPDIERWGLLIEWLHSKNLDVVVSHGPNDVWTGVPVKLVTTESLRQLVLNLSGATAVITVDNGIGHIASALGCKTLILWPPISSVPFIAPTWSKTTTLIYMQPARVRADQLRDLVMKELKI